MTAELRAFSMAVIRAFRWTTVSSNDLAPLPERLTRDAHPAAIPQVPYHEPGNQNEDDGDNRDVEGAERFSYHPGLPDRTRPGQPSRPGERPEETIEHELGEVHTRHARREGDEGADYRQQSGEESCRLAILLEPLVGGVKVVLIDE